MSRFFSCHYSILVMMTMIFDQVSPSNSQDNIVSKAMYNNFFDKLCNEYDQSVNRDIYKKKVSKYYSKKMTQVIKRDTTNYDKPAPGLSSL